MNIIEARSLLADPLSGVLNGNESAVELCLSMYEICQMWDDLVDGDTPENPDAVMFQAVIGLNANPVWRAHNVYLMPILVSIWQDWHTSNQFESSKDQLQKAYMLRAGIYRFFIAVATCLHGAEYGKNIAPRVWGLYGETIDGFVEETKNV